MLVLVAFATYVLVIFAISALTKGRERSNSAFFLAGRTVPWWVVAIGMVGDSISGVTFVSVPGMVGASGMSYLQLCVGFFLGYVAISYILLPLYYRLQVTSIYEYLDQRYGRTTYRTGALFFLISKMFGAATKLYLVSLILQSFAFAPLGVPYPLTVLGLVVIIWLYTRIGGMGTIVWTDVLQTISLVVALTLMLYQLGDALGLGLGEMVQAVTDSPLSRVVHWEDWLAPNHLVKQLISGALIVIVMTGLDQNMMQKNLTCPSLSQARKNMLTYGFAFIPLNFLFLSLGILLLMYAQQYGITLPSKGDEILPYLVDGYLGNAVLIAFTLGITAASLSNADSALTSLTTSVCVDLLGMRGDEPQHRRMRDYIHVGICLTFALVVIAIAGLQQSSVLNTIFVAVSYTYGPLLGLFAFGLITERRVRERYTPYICIASPILSHLTSVGLSAVGYQMGYELLLVNGLLTMLGLYLTSTACPKVSQPT